jgi:hypothetical protein
LDGNNELERQVQISDITTGEIIKDYDNDNEVDKLSNIEEEIEMINEDRMNKEIQMFNNS